MPKYCSLRVVFTTTNPSSQKNKRKCAHVLNKKKQTQNIQKNRKDFIFTLICNCYIYIYTYIYRELCLRNFPVSRHTIKRVIYFYIIKIEKKRDKGNSTYNIDRERRRLVRSSRIVRNHDDEDVKFTNKK